MMGKISKGMASADFNEHVRFSSLLNDGEYAIHDMSDPENPKQYKYFLSKNIDGNQMQCQATITYDDQGVPSVYI